jgi:hypothetical protein
VHESIFIEAPERKQEAMREWELQCRLQFSLRRAYALPL